MTRQEYIATTTARYLAVLKMESVNVNDIECAVLQAENTAARLEAHNCAPWQYPDNRATLAEAARGLDAIA